ncbi:restriction endonuclease subunit S [Streptomyces guryensis]|uniref:Restriction endonuclease subunit S n=1 Tax=Streptomyces guryensis TaxID=2886947 RepID=A0A9Q3VY29_9ACTN|nr:restriction endonuclease subunit S [Streptomyces guryensis]MCD9880561.1 restriction endonuclease subunit S [Streptomyces guryensis]
MGREAEIRWVPVGELGEVRMGKQLSPASRNSGTQLPYLRVANVYEGRITYADVKYMGFSASEQVTYALRPGDILLNEGQENLGMVGRSAIYEGAPDTYYFQNTLIRFRPGPEILPQYAQAVFVNWRRQGVFANIAEKTSISHLGGSRFAALQFPVLPLTDQQRIVNILTAESDLERSVEESIAKNRHIRLGILLAAMKPITQTSSPTGWARIPLKEIVPFAEYGISEALVNDPGGMPVLRMNNINEGQPDIADLRYSPVTVPERLQLRHRDVLFNRTNSIEHVGKAALWGGELPKATFASYLVRLNPDKNRLLPEYLVEWLQHPLIRQRVKAISTVAVQQVNVNPTRLRELEIDLPVSLGEQARIVQALAACDEQIRHEQAELAKLRQLALGLADNLLVDKVQT